MQQSRDANCRERQIRWLNRSYPTNEEDGNEEKAEDKITALYGEPLIHRSG